MSELVQTKLSVSKGLSSKTEVGGFVAKVSSANVSAAGVHMKYALIEGNVQIVDTAWAVVKASYSLPKYHMIEYDLFEVEQEFSPVEDKAWLPVRQEFSYLTKAGKAWMRANDLGRHDFGSGRVADELKALLWATVRAA